MLQSVPGRDLNYSGSLIAPELLSSPRSWGKEHGAGVLFSFFFFFNIYLATLGLGCITWDPLSQSTDSLVVTQARYLQRTGLVDPQHVGS